MDRHKTGRRLAAVLSLGCMFGWADAAPLSPKAAQEFSDILPAKDATNSDTNTAANTAITATSDDGAYANPSRTHRSHWHETIHVLAHRLNGDAQGRYQQFLLTPSNAIEAETRAFGSQPIPIGGGQFSPYLGTDAKDLALPEPRWFPASFSDWMQQDQALGDWGGLRSKLRDHGVDIGGRWLGEWAGNPTGGRSQAARYADEEAFFANFDMKKLVGYDLGTVHFLAIMRQGTNNNANLPAFNGPMEIGGGGEWTHLGRLSWEKVWNRYMRTEMGWINVENDFGQSSNYWGANLYCQFQNNGICGMPQSLAQNSGYSWYPTALPGGWVKFYPTGDDRWLVSTGIYAVEPTIWHKENSWKLGLVNPTGKFVPVQLGWHMGGRDDYSGPLQSNIKVGAYWDSSKVQDVNSQLGSFVNPAFATNANVLGATNAATVNSSNVRGRYGMWVQGDHMLQRDANDPRRGTAVFGSFIWGDPRTSVAPYYMTFGMVRKGTFKSRPDDTISLGGKVAWMNSSLTQFAKRCQRQGCGVSGAEWFHPGDKGLAAPSSETALELNYGYRPSPWLLVRPGVQYYFNPGATAQYGDAFLMDLEAQVVF